MRARSRRPVVYVGVCSGCKRLSDDAMLRRCDGLAAHLAIARRLLHRRYHPRQTCERSCSSSILLSCRRYSPAAVDQCHRGLACAGDDTLSAVCPGVRGWARHNSRTAGMGQSVGKTARVTSGSARGTDAQGRTTERQQGGGPQREMRRRLRNPPARRHLICLESTALPSLPCPAPTPS